VKQSANLEQALKLLPQLSPEEQLEVKKRVDYLLKEIPTHPSRPADDWLTEGVCSELVRRGYLHKGMDWHKVAPKGYSKTVEVVREFLLKAVRRPLNTAQKYALGRLVARALADYLENVPGFGLRVMLQNLDKATPALDASYPGYVASGMLGLLIKVR
jgi:hypothetical protein